MRTKLKLHLDQLTVDSFDTSGVRAENGTVFGEQCTCYTNCTCPGCPTCDNTACDQASCAGTCDTCNATLDHTCDPYLCGPSAAKPWICGNYTVHVDCV